MVRTAASTLQRRCAAAGFTLLELLVVITVIAMLTALLVAAANLVRATATRGQSEAILAQLALGLQQIASARGSLPEPGTHPFAHSLEPRRPFVRGGGDGSTAGDPVQATGLALVGVELSQLAPAHAPRLLLPRDRLADPDLPHAYGLARWELGLPGAFQARYEAFRRLPRSLTPADDPDAVAGSQLVEPGKVKLKHELPRQSAALAVQVGPLMDTLTELDAVREPAADYTVSVTPGDLACSSEPQPQWQPGLIRHGGAWVAYSLGTRHLVDAWGREILLRTDPASGELSLLSAGADGVFAWHPGADRRLQTPAHASAPAGDDRDGRADNLTYLIGD